MHDGGEGSTSGAPAGLPDLAPVGESLLPPLPAGLGAVRSPKTARRLRRQLCRRSCHLLPTGERIGGTGDDAAPDDTARADGERGQDAIGATARGELRFPRVQHLSFLPYRRGAVYRPAPVPEGCSAPAPADSRRDDATQACRESRTA